MFDVIVSRREDQSPTVTVLELQHPEGKALPAFSAGAHIDVQVDTDLVRQYSLCSNPADRTHYRLGVLREAESRGGSAGIHAHFEEGLKVAISEPKNHFHLMDTQDHSILVGGGIGITPLIAMAYSLRDAGRSFELHYCVRSAAQAGFIAELEKEFPEQFHLYVEDVDDGNRLDIDATLQRAGAQSHVYVCGPAGFMDWIIQSAQQAGYEPGHIHREFFSADVDTSGAEFEVVAEASGVTVQVPDGVTIAEALREAGVQVDVSCEQGICGTCICDVIEGTPDHKDQFLNDEEREMNDQIAVCCSRALSDRLVLDI